MSKVRKTILGITVAACLLGVGLILVGLASGGLQDLVRSSAASTKMTKQEETYGNILFSCRILGHNRNNIFKNSRFSHRIAPRHY